MSDAPEQFSEDLRRSLSANEFVKLTLSNYKGPEPHLQKVAVRMIETKQGRKLSFQNSYERQQTVKNFGVEEGIARVTDLLSSGFRSAHLFTVSHDIQLTIGKKSSRIIKGKPTFTRLPSTSHDRPKTTLIDPGSYYLRALGITMDDGRVRSQQRDKWRQITRYVEILRDLFETSRIKDAKKLTILDMGSGKGYLTFAAYDYFANVCGLDVSMTGVDSRPELIALCNQIADASEFTGLRFIAGDILDFAVERIDILIALHACDTATDDALYKGIRASAEIIVAAPCCHKEVRSQMAAPDFLQGVLKHGVISERTAETVTDGLRSLLLEESGYRSKVFEFVPSEHTPKNNMIAAVRDDRKPDRGAIAKQIAELLSAFSIAHQHLHSLLEENGREL
ncbi:MAG TPA: SAM-dependent methyltransferase [Pyrinomonadaceae bacterium]